MGEHSKGFANTMSVSYFHVWQVFLLSFPTAATFWHVFSCLHHILENKGTFLVCLSTSHTTKHQKFHEKYRTSAAIYTLGTHRQSRSHTVQLAPHRQG